MKSSTPLLSIFAGAALLCAGNLMAQQTPQTSADPGDTQSVTRQTAEGELTVNSAPAPAPHIGPAPAFEQLAGSTGSINADQAKAYPPLANDFLHADGNEDNKISKTEYEHWVKQPKQ